MTPDTWLYHYQTLLAGLSALAGGAFVLAQAFLHERRVDQREKTNRDDRKRAFSAIVLSDLVEFRSDLIDLLQRLDEYHERVANDPNLIHDFSKLEIPNTSTYLYEDWRNQVGFETRLIVSLWFLRADLSDFEDAVRGLNLTASSGAEPLPLFRDVSDDQSMGEWANKLGDLAAAGENVIETAEQVIVVLERALPGDLAAAIKKGDINEIALGELQGRPETYRQRKTGSSGIPGSDS